jgi:hypothetical protein
MVMSPPLPLVPCKLRPIFLRIISTSEDTIRTILIQNIRIEELAETVASMALCIGSHLLTSGCANTRIIWLSVGEGLHAHVAVVFDRGHDTGVFEESGTPEAVYWRGRLVVHVGTGDDDVKLRLPLTDVGGFGGGDAGAEEGALDAGD